MGSGVASNDGLLLKLASAAKLSFPLLTVVENGAMDSRPLSTFNDISVGPKSRPIYPARSNPKLAWALRLASSPLAWLAAYSDSNLIVLLHRPSIVRPSGMKAPATARSRSASRRPFTRVLPLRLFSLKSPVISICVPLTRRSLISVLFSSVFMITSAEILTSLSVKGFCPGLDIFRLLIFVASVAIWKVFFSLRTDRSLLSLPPIVTSPGNSLNSSI